MKKSELKNILQQYQIFPSKKLGQNFLIDENLLNFIIRTAAPKEEDFIIEVGPGLGGLTKKLIESSATIIAIEYDSRLVKYLREKIKAERFSLIEADACRTNFSHITQNKNFRIIANLPYSITTPLIANLINMKNPPHNILLLLQKETAMRFAAKPNNKDYGSMTVKVQNLYDVKYIRTVPADVFYPKPEVQSAIVEFSILPSRPSSYEKQILDELVKTAFAHRRKKLITNLSAKYNTLDLVSLFKDLSISTNDRAENLSVDQYYLIVKKIITNPISLVKK